MSSWALAWGRPACERRIPAQRAFPLLPSQCALTLALALGQPLQTRVLNPLQADWALCCHAVVALALVAHAPIFLHVDVAVAALVVEVVAWLPAACGCRRFAASALIASFAWSSALPLAFFENLVRRIALTSPVTALNAGD